MPSNVWFLRSLTAGAGWGDLLHDLGVGFGALILGMVLYVAVVRLRWQLALMLQVILCRLFCLRHHERGSLCWRASEDACARARVAHRTQAPQAPTRSNPRARSPAMRPITIQTCVRALHALQTSAAQTCGIAVNLSEKLGTGGSGFWQALGIALFVTCAGSITVADGATCSHARRRHIPARLPAHCPAYTMQTDGC